MSLDANILMKVPSIIVFNDGFTLFLAPQHYGKFDLRHG